MNCFPNYSQKFIYQEKRCELCWRDVTELKFPRILSPIECSSEWISCIMNLVYYGRINNITDQNSGYVIRNYNLKNAHNTVPKSYETIIENFPDNIHP